jgi:N-acetylmuramoyl-L-alanine amidase
VSLCLFLALIATSLPGLSLEETLDSLGSTAAMRWDPLLQSGVFTLEGHEAAFFAQSSSPGMTLEPGFILIDHELVYEAPTPLLENGLLNFSESFVQTLRSGLEMAIANEASAAYKIAAIIIDPGHGGRDAGASGSHTQNGVSFKAVEKDIVLEVSKRLYNQLKAAYPDKRILMTRSGDSYPSLEDRVDIANAVPLDTNEAIIYISVHANASLNASARGYEVWYLSAETERNLVDPSLYADAPELVPIFNNMLQDEFLNESIQIAQLILRQYGAAFPNMPSRGLKEEEWFVVKNSRMPAVLVELGFVTNKEDALMMISEGGLQKMADALYKGISDFISDYENAR